MSAVLRSKAVAARPFARAQRAPLACKAVAADVSPAARRSVLFAGMMPALLNAAAPALALIPDEEDEELVERAKANRKARLASQKLTTREFMQTEGLKDVLLDAELVPVQKAVNKLSKVGAKVEAGDAKGAASLLNEGWVSDFKVASVKIGSNADAVNTLLDDLKAAASKGDATSSKKAYVALVSGFSNWTNTADLSSKLAGL